MIYDAVIIGAGMFGLALARTLQQQDRTVLVLEQHDIGAGASGGLLGALMPSGPNAKGPLPILQRHALARYPDDIAALNAETGYRRTGRLSPAPEGLSREEVAERFPRLAALLSPAISHYQWDATTAQITPRRLLAALAQGLDIVTNAGVTRIAPNSVETAGARYQARQIIVTAGWQSAQLTGASVTGVKGHALALAPVLSDAPLLYTRDCYVVFHDGFTAIGSTTEKDWRDTEVDPAQIAILQARAAQLLPDLAAAPVTESWAGIRPRGPQALPLIARTADDVVVATGGYKIGFALGFTVARLVSAALTQPEWPENFWAWADETEKIGLFSYA